MEVVGVVASVIGIVSFVETCIKFINLLRGYFNKVPAIIQNITRDLQAANPILERARRTMMMFPRDSILDINNIYTNCKRMILKMSRTAEKVEQTRNKSVIRAKIPKLERQRAELDEAMLQLGRELRLLNCPTPAAGPRPAQSGSYQNIRPTDPYNQLQPYGAMPYGQLGPRGATARTSYGQRPTFPAPAGTSYGQIPGFSVPPQTLYWQPSGYHTPADSYSAAIAPGYGQQHSGYSTATNQRPFNPNVSPLRPNPQYGSPQPRATTNGQRPINPNVSPLRPNPQSGSPQQRATANSQRPINRNAPPLRPNPQYRSTQPRATTNSQRPFNRREYEVDSDEGGEEEESDEDTEEEESDEGGEEEESDEE